MHFERVELGFGGLIYWLVSIEEKEEERVDEELRKNWKRAAFYRDSWRFLSEAISFSFPLSSSCQLFSNKGIKRSLSSYLQSQEIVGERSLEASSKLNFFQRVHSRSRRKLDQTPGFRLLGFCPEILRSLLPSKGRKLGN